MDHYTDKEFNKDFTKHYSLLFQLEEQQYSFAIYDKRSGKLHVLRSVSLNAASPGDMLSKLKVSVTSEDMLQVPFSEIKVSISYTPFTLVPRVLFKEELTRNYLSLSAEVLDSDTVTANNIKSAFIRNIFSVPAQDVAYIREVFDGPRLFHVGSALLESAMRNKELFADQQLILDIKPGIIHLLYFEKKEFRFMNQFRFTNREDFLYFVLIVCDQFSVDRNTCDMKLSGEIMPDSQLFGELWKFFKNISFLPVNENIVLPKELQEIPLYIFNTLLSLDLCE